MTDLSTLDRPAPTPVKIARQSRARKSSPAVVAVTAQQFGEHVGVTRQRVATW